MELERSLSGPPLLYRSVQDRVKRFILEQELQPGDALPPETHLARDLGVSRSSVREAVKALESLGILETRPGLGLYVRAFSLDPLLDNLAYSLLFERDSLVELLEVREQLETGLLARAAAGLTDTALAQLTALVRRMRDKAERGEAFPDEDRAFHRLINEATGNRVLLKLLDVFWIVFARARDRAITVDAAPERTWRNHERILAALVARDAAAAQQAMADHFADLHARLRHAALRQRRDAPSGQPVATGETARAEGKDEA